MSSKTLITGASGFIGQALTRRLMEAGADLRLLVRDPQRLAPGISGAADVVEGDITDPQSLHRAMQDVDVVFSIAGTFREPSLPDRRYREVNVDAVRYIITAARKNGVRRVVHCSSCGIHGDVPAGHLASEDDPLRPDGIYEITKAEGDRVARELGRELGVQVAVIRPTPVYGPGDTRLLKLFKLVKSSPTVLLGPGTAHYHLVYVDDVVQAALLAAEHPEASGEAFLVGGAEIPSLNEMIATIAGLLGRTGRAVVRIPAKPVWLLGWMCEAICRPLGLVPPIYRRRVEFFTNNRAFDIGKARAVLGYEPKVPMRDGLTETLAWYQAEGLL